MMQTIEGHDVYVVDIPDSFIPLPVNAGRSPHLHFYAEALNAAITQGIVNKPGKYAIEINIETESWRIYAITE